MSKLFIWVRHCSQLCVVLRIRNVNLNVFLFIPRVDNSRRSMRHRGPFVTSQYGPLWTGVASFVFPAQIRHPGPYCCHGRVWPYCWPDHIVVMTIYMLCEVVIAMCNLQTENCCRGKQDVQVTICHDINLSTPGGQVQPQWGGSLVAE